MEQQVFSQTEYLSTFTTFIYGYVATQFLSGWSSIITRRKKIALSKEHLAWTILCFILLVDLWWSSWRKSEFIAQDNLFFYSTLLTPFILYFLSHLLFPDLDHLFGNNLKDYLSAVFRKIMIVLSILMLSFLLNDMLFKKVIAHNEWFNWVGLLLGIIMIFVASSVALRRIVLVFSFGLLSFHIYLLTENKLPFDQVEGFSFVEHLTIFITFIYGFVTWRFLEGWGVIIDRFRKLNIGFDYLLWTILGFLLMLDVWWNSWFREAYLPRNIFYFMIALAVPTLFYFFSAIVFPVELLKLGYSKINFYYHRNRRLICLFFCLILVSNLIVANTMEETSFLSQDNLFRFFAISLSIIGTISSKLILHRIILFLGFIAIIAHGISK